MSWRVIQADVMDGLASLPDASVQTVVTSPPYWGLRDYGTAEWEGGDAACDHRQQLGGEGITSAKQNTSAGTQTLAYRDVCGKCGAVRRDQQLGLEPTPEAYVERMVAVFREVRRVLRPDGTVWLNIGDSYAGSASQGGPSEKQQSNAGSWHNAPRPLAPGLKPKDLVGIPWRLAFALQADGWYLRADIIWAKPNPMPESVTDRPTKSHEYVFLLTRSARYFYDADAVREDAIHAGRVVTYGPEAKNHNGGDGVNDRRTLIHRDVEVAAGRNLRSVWSIPTEPFPEAHFATFPKALVVPCVKAGTSEKGCCPECGAAWVRQVKASGGTIGEGWHDHSNDLQRGHHDASNGKATDGTYRREMTGWEAPCVHDAEPIPNVVLDPFTGSGTVGVVALRYGRSFVGIELNPTYAEMARERIRQDGPLFNIAAEVV